MGQLFYFNHFQAIIQGIQHEFMAIGLAETNTSPDTSSLYTLPNHTPFYQKTRSGKKSGTGVALYIHNSLNATKIAEVSHCTTNIESLIVKITTTDKPIYFGVVYRPNDGDKLAFCEQFQLILEHLPSERTFIMGDFNINLLSKSPNNDFEESIFSNDHAPLISIATHSRGTTKPSCIDNIITNEHASIIFSGTLLDNISHHLPIFQFSNLQAPRGNKEKVIQYYDFNEKNVSSFVSELESKIQTLSASSNFDDFSVLYQNTLDSNCKLEKPKITKRTTQNNPWITEGIIQSIQKKHELKQDWVKTVTKKNPEGNTHKRNKFVSYRRKLTSIITKAKSSFSLKQFSECKDDSKKTWKLINSLRGTSKTDMKPIFKIDNKRITDRRIIANSFNKYFQSIASKLNDQISDSPLSDQKIPHFSKYMYSSNKSSIYLQDCDSNEISTIISELQSGKSSDIPIKIIKKTAQIISPLLSKYFNMFMQKGIFPDTCKTGRITPIYKKDDAQLLENYRPISTLSIFGKVFEKVIYSRLYNFCISQNILYENQFGFRKGHSTSHAINYSVNHIKSELQKKNYVLGIFIDLSKAFDTIDHKQLTQKLNYYGIRGSANNLISSYLSNRKQYTECLGVKSDPLDVLFGVPQGSVLGPLLFLIYINDIVNCSSLGKFVLFADDTNIFVSGKSLSETYSKANDLLSELNSYMTTNLLHINLLKCCHIVFKPNTKLVDQPYPLLELKINGVSIKRVEYAVFLGVTIDENLSWDQHLVQLKRKLYYATATLSYLRKYIPQEIRNNLYHTLFESHLTYCISSWGEISSTKMESIHRIQKKVIRILFGDLEAYKSKFMTSARTRPIANQILGEEFFKREHTKPLFREQKLLTVNNLYSLHCFMETFKILKFHSPVSLFNQYTISNRSCITYTCLIPPTSNTHFFYNSSKIWNTVRSRFKIPDLSISTTSIKERLRQAIHKNQHLYHEIEWIPSYDYDISKI